jgi:flagellar biosynthetic protein FlhB
VSGEKSEKPTTKRLKKAHHDGSGTMRTPELASWAGLLVATVMLPGVLRRGADGIGALLVSVAGVFGDPDPGQAVAVLRAGVDVASGTVLPLLVTLAGVGLLANAAQGGLRVAPKQFTPQFKRLNPFTGLKRILGPQGAWELVKTLLKTAVLGLVVWRAVHIVIPTLATSGALPLSSVLATVWGTAVSLLRQAAAAGLILAAADSAVVRRRTNKGLRMSKQDIKDEHKQSEGDPMLKGAIRSRQMQMSRNRMMSDIAEADVIMVNPTHVAVALRYQPEKGAPRVVAKGAGVIASRIREAAEEHRVPMVADVPLARALHRSCEIGQEIPAELFTAVARVLAFVMALKTRGSAVGVHRNPMPEPPPDPAVLRRSRRVRRTA